MKRMDKIDKAVVKAMRAAKIHPELIHAYKRTGRILSKQGSKLLSPEELQEWKDAINEWRMKYDPDHPLA